MSRHSLLSNAQRQAILTAQFDLDERQGARYGTWSDQDLLRMDRRRDSNRCGFAVQLCLLGFPGWPPKRRDRVPRPLLLYVAEQWGIQTDHSEEYFRRQPTRSEPLQEILDLYGFRYSDGGVGEEWVTWMQAQAHRWHTPAGLWMALREELRHRHIIWPAISLLEHMAWGAHRPAEEEAFTKRSAPLSPLQRAEFAPRIRDLPDGRLFTFESPEPYTAWQDRMPTVDASLVERNWDELLRMAESIRKGKLSASLLVSKLAVDFEARICHAPIAGF